MPIGVKKNQEGKKRPFPSRIEPMLCTLEETISNNPVYLYEIKWDGYRILSFKNRSRVTLHSRKSLDYSSKYPPVAEAIKHLRHSCVLDSEVVVLNSKGLPDFDALQIYNGNDPIAYYVFDILWLDAYDLMRLPLIERRKILAKVIAPDDVLRISEEFEDADALFKQIKKLGLEGVVAKRKDSTYKPGKRGPDWLKYKTEIRQDYVIGGWTESESGRPFAALMFGYYNQGKLYYLGHSGGGFKEKEIPVIKKKLEKLETKKKPFVNEAEAYTKIHWVKPLLVADFKFDTFTKSGKVRKSAIFLGFRNDKDPKEVQYEPPVVAHTIKREKFHLASPAKSNWKKIELDSENSWTATIDGHEVTFNGVDREIWRGYTKAELIQYYHTVAKYMMPHLKDRPQSLHIKPINAYAEGFYIKDIEGKQPDWAEIFSVKRKHKEQGKRDIIDYLVCQNEASLLYLVNLGCIDINPWTSRVQSPEQPDYIAIDLDPTEKDDNVNFKKVIEVAMATKEYCDLKKLKAFCKTSGKTGIHFYIPCGGFNFKEARYLAEQICGDVHKTTKAISTTEVSIAKRGDKVYLDPNQNDYADTLAAPYSARPCVSFPEN